MGRLHLLIGGVALLVANAICYGQSDVHRFELDSEAVGARYAIEVVLPSGRPVSDSGYPVMYCTDWFVLGEYLEALPELMDMGPLTEPFVLVGIAQGGDRDGWATARTRDFTPARPSDDYWKRNTHPPAMELAGGAERFAVFVRDELIPRIESGYPVDPARRGLLGYSLGALWRTYILVNEPDLFHYYLLGSPSLWFNDYVVAEALDSLPAGPLDSIGRVYVSVGSDESWEMLKGFGVLRDALRARGIDGTRAKMEIIDDAGHVGAMPIALYNGLRFLFPRR